MDCQPVRLIGFDDDEALNDILAGFGLFADYRNFLPNHLTEILRKQHPSVELRSVELLGKPNLGVGGMPSPDDNEHVIVDTMKVPLELKVLLSTTGHDLHELKVASVINATNVDTIPSITTDLYIRDHNEMS